MASFAQDYSAGLTVSVIGHALLVLAFSFNLISMPFKDVPPVQLAIEATVIDMGAVRRKQEAEKQRLLELERQKQAVAAERRKKAQAQQRKREQQLAEQKRRQEAERKRLAEQERQADAERRRVTEQKRKAEEARKAELKRKAEEARIAEQKRKAEVARIAEQRRQEEIQRQFQSELAAEEARLLAISSGALQKYKARLMAHVKRYMIWPPGVASGTICVSHVSVIPGGEVVNNRIGQCNGSEAVKRAVEAAVRKASPFPMPDDPGLFERNWTIDFEPEK